MKKVIIFFISLIIFIYPCVSCLAYSTINNKSDNAIISGSDCYEVIFYFGSKDYQVILVLNDSNYKNINFNFDEIQVLDSTSAYIWIEYKNEYLLDTTISFNSIQDFSSQFNKLCNTNFSGVYGEENYYLNAISYYEPPTVSIPVSNSSISSTLNNIHSILTSIRRDLQAIKNYITGDSTNLNYQNSILWLLIFILFSVCIIIGSLFLKHFSFWKW